MEIITKNTQVLDINSISPGFDRLLEQCRLVNFKRGDYILYQGEVPRYAYFIKKGVIKAYDIGNAGDEKIVALSTTGEFIPPAWVFSKSPVSLYYYSAFTDSDVFLMQRADVQKVIEKDDNAARKFFDKYVGLYASAVQQVNVLEQSKGTDKILYILQHLVMRFGRRNGRDTKTIVLRLTHQDIASMTGLTRETTSVELNRLKKKGVITYKDQHYTVHTSKLQAMLSSDEFTNFVY